MSDESIGMLIGFGVAIPILAVLFARFLAAERRASNVWEAQEKRRKEEAPMLERKNLDFIKKALAEYFEEREKK